MLKLPFGASAVMPGEGSIQRSAVRTSLIDECDVIFAVLDGTDVDGGTATEIGYSFAALQPILGYR